MGPQCLQMYAKHINKMQFSPHIQGGTMYLISLETPLLSTALPNGDLLKRVNCENLTENTFS